MNSVKETIVNRKDLYLGLMGSFFMMLGDLSLSLITPNDSDQGLLLRQAYFDGEYPAWKLVFLIITGVVGIFGYWYGLKSMHDSINEKYTKTRRCFKFVSMFFCFSGLAIHAGVGIGAYLTSSLAGEYGTDVATRFAEDYLSHVFTGFYPLYIPIAAIFMIHLFMLITGKTIYSRKMTLLAPVILMGIFGLIPDIRQNLGCHITTFDYVCSQCSGNAAPFIYYLMCLVLPDGFKLRK
ncbi:MAG: hypothetical protein IJ757_07300 [Clostridiales bacterium]|nr:hypothetical protein [Clostridiales bacterium]